MAMIEKFYALTYGEKQEARGVMKEARDRGVSLDLSYWDRKKSDWQISAGLIRFFCGEDLNFYEISPEEANDIIEKIKSEQETALVPENE